MAAAVAQPVAQPVKSISTPSAPHASASHVPDRILPNPNPANIHEALSTVVEAAAIGAAHCDAHTTGTGPRVRHGSNQSNHSLRAGFYGAQNRLSRGSNSGGTIGSAHSYGSFGENPPAYGDHTGTKGWGTGNTYEKSTRSSSIPGAYGHSVGMKGFGSGNDFERSRDTFNSDLMVKNGSRRGSNVSGHSAPLAAHSFGSGGSGHSRRSVPADAVSTTSRTSTHGGKLGDKVKAGVDAVASKFKKSDA
ncbi:hypothetical protein VKT23_011965 [Stygiomarasmius scandens]|uniref:Uncharacterized protein n=1 Tax=Marasmiellus scandens TaxID=2682957 RepID=A0ABR1JAU2_9AGAR